MKKIVALLSFAFTLTLVTPTFAQTVTFDGKDAASYVLDTITNAGGGYVKINLFKKYEYIAVQPVLTKISGTLVNSANIKLQGSVDGTNWQIVNAADTLTVANQTTNTIVWVVPKAEACPYAYLRVYYAGAGTQTSSLKAKFCFKE